MIVQRRLSDYVRIGCEGWRGVMSLIYSDELPVTAARAWHSTLRAVIEEAAHLDNHINGRYHSTWLT